jgi:hypothetical protein
MNYHNLRMPQDFTWLMLGEHSDFGGGIKKI